MSARRRPSSLLSAGLPSFIAQATSFLICLQISVNPSHGLRNHPRYRALVRFFPSVPSNGSGSTAVYFVGRCRDNFQVLRIRVWFLSPWHFSTGQRKKQLLTRHRGFFYRMRLLRLARGMLSLPAGATQSNKGCRAGRWRCILPRVMPALVGYRDATPCSLF